MELMKVRNYDPYRPKLGRIDLNSYKGHSEWELSVEGDGVRTSQSYIGYPQEYVDLEFQLTMKRKFGYYQCLFIAPAIFLAMLVPMLFVLGPTNKFSLVAAMMVSLAIFSEMLAEMVPVAHGSVPILSQYYMGLFGLITLAAILSIITANLAEKASYRNPPPHWLCVLCIDILGKFMCHQR